MPFSGCEDTRRRAKHTRPTPSGIVRKQPLDTRSKILSQAAPPPCNGQLHVARGWFDVLTADICRALLEVKPANGTLAVLVYRESDARPAPLTADDRAQMLAALDCVDYVYVCDFADADSTVTDLGASADFDVELSTERDVVRDVLQLHGQR